jgi:integrase
MEAIPVSISTLKRSPFLQLVWRERKGRRVKVCRVSTRTTDPVQAEIMRREKEVALNEQRQDPFERNAKRPLAEHLAEYLEDMRADGTSEKQIHMVGQRVERILDSTGMKFIADLAPSPIKRAVAAFRRWPHSKKSSKKDNSLLSAQSRNFYLQAIKQLSRWMVAEQRMPFDPLVSLKKWGVQTDRRHDRDRLSAEQFAKLIAAAERSQVIVEGYDGSMRSRLYQLAYATGLRRSELASLTPASFKLTRRKPTVTVKAACAKNRQEATIRLHDDLVRLICSWLEGYPRRSDEPLFPHLAGKKTGKMMKRDLRDAEVAYQTEDGLYRDFHALRHSFISNLWDAEATPPQAQRLARHSDIRLTMKYSHVDTEAVDAVIQRMPSLPKPNDECKS